MDLNNFFNSLTDDQKTQLANALLSSVDSPSGEDKPKAKAKPKKVEPKAKKPVEPKKLPQRSVDNNFTVTKAESVDSQNRRKEPVRARKNEWKDTGEFRDIHTPEFEPTPRKRPPPKKVDVDCHVCGRPFKVDQRFVYGEYYRCNKCVGKS